MTQTGTRNAPQTAVYAEDLVKTYGTLAAVDRVSFTVRPGETFGILGPNGAGKSTLMRMIYCRTPSTSGTLLVRGLDTRVDFRRIKAEVGIVPQENNLDPDLDVTENLQVYARYFRLPNRKAAEETRRLLAFMNLEGKRNTEVAHLSGGMKRRLVVARALINRPGLLALDEPTTGLDPSFRHDLWDRLRELRQERITILLCTHYMEEAEQLCDRLMILERGRILASGSPRELISRHAQTFVLEIQETAGDPSGPTPAPPVVAETHGANRYFFAPALDLLTPILERYPGRRSFLRPSNLEDVFLRLTGRRRLE